METVVLSPSMASSVNTCTTQSLLRTMHLGTTASENEKTKAGKAFHRACEMWLMGRELGECLAAFRSEYEAFSDQFITADSKYHKGNLEKILGVYLRRNPIAQQVFEVIEAEQQIEVTESVGPDLQVVFTDILDGVVRMKDSGEFWAYELKTTGGWITDNYVRDYFLRGQIMSHVYTARKHGFPVVGCLLNVIEINKLPELGRTTVKGLPFKCRTHNCPCEECWAGHVKFERYQIQPTEEQVQSWKRDNMATALEYRANIHTYTDVLVAPREGVLNNSCGRCDFQQFCLAPNLDKLIKRERSDTIRSSGIELQS